MSSRKSPDGDCGFPVPSDIIYVVDSETSECGSTDSLKKSVTSMETGSGYLSSQGSSVVIEEEIYKGEEQMQKIYACVEAAFEKKVKELESKLCGEEQMQKIYACVEAAFEKKVKELESKLCKEDKSYLFEASSMNDSFMDDLPESVHLRLKNLFNSGRIKTTDLKPSTIRMLSSFDETTGNKIISEFEKSRFMASSDRNSYLVKLMMNFRKTVEKSQKKELTKATVK